MMQQSNYTTCYYHPANNAIASCEACGKEICAFDKQIYRKKLHWYRIGFDWVYNLQTYCKDCYASKIDKDFRTHLLSLILLPLSIIFYIFLFFTLPELFSGYNKVNVTTILIILFIALFIPFLLVKDYFKIKKTHINLITDLDNGKNTHCFFHKDNFATSICKNCQKLICEKDTKKIDYFSQDEYCLTCYNIEITNKLHPVRAIVGGIIVEGTVLFMVLSNNYFNISFLNQTTTLAFGIVFALSLIFGFALMKKKIKNSRNELANFNSTISPHNTSFNKTENVITPSESTQKICNKCGSPLPHKSKKCPNCGNNVL